MRDSASARLLELVSLLTPTQQSVMETMASAMLSPLDIEYLPNSDIVDLRFAEAFGNILLLHHAIHEEPLNKASFEYALKNCALSIGRTARVNDRRGSSVWDVAIEETRYSCKTEAARGLSPATVKIEKLMEARWIRDCTNPHKCATKVRTEVPAHLAGYDRILVLRAFRHTAYIEYVLEEPPKDLISDAFTAIPLDSFTKEGARESYGANVNADDGSRIFRVLLDSSVEKVRLWFSTNHCIRHASWRVSTEREATP